MNNIRIFVPQVIFGLAQVIAQVFPSAAYAEDKNSKTYEIDAVVITAPAMQAPLEINLDPKTPIQPLPVQDGASFLKTVPGMSVVRKGGTDGDPVFRGMAGSRLDILLDGENILGGCGMRMDPPTAYIYPETYDRITVIKGPETVLYGPGNSAGVVLFERSFQRFEQPGLKLDSSLMGGSFGRHDEVIDLTAGTSLFYFRGAGTDSRSDTYQDGSGKDVHSKYNRWSANLAAGWTPDDDSRLELTATRSNGKAAYADRSMDGAKFARDNYGVKFERRNLTPWMGKIEGQAYYNYIDHVMDNYSMRTFVSTAMSPTPSVSNPDRKTNGGRISATLRPFSMAMLVLGADMQSNKHTLRSTKNQPASPYKSMSRKEDARFDQKSLFGEWTQFMGERGKLIAGLRADWWEVRDKRQMLTLGATQTANPTAGRKRDETLPSGFIRFEQGFAGNIATIYTGIGHNERFPDYWELVGAGREGPTASDLSAFATTNPEKTTQIDTGIIWNTGGWSGSVAGFYNKIADYIMTQSNVSRTTPTRTVSIVRNVDATTWGGEAGARRSFTPNLNLDVSLAYVHGDNDTEDRPLAQMPPLEARLGMNWDNKTWSLGSLMRLVSPQNRIAVNEGNIVGQDIGRTPGFGVFSINGGWRPKKVILFAVGIDNLFDKTYAEHISRSGAMIAGFEQTTRVNEPGRNFWVKATYSF
jgi:iron complex outermembrane recepter protein